MKYQIKKIAGKNYILECEKFQITNYMWNSMKNPKAYGYMGYIKGQGFYVQMTCEEQNPKRTFLNFKDAVYQDSAMETFLAFPEKDDELSNDVMYVNFEVNSNAAMYIAYGKGRQGRQYMPEHYLKDVDCKSVIEEDRWTISFLIPESFLCKECGVADLEEAVIYCNFYKISESKEIEHYGSYSKIESETPNFHLPVCFAKAVMNE